MKIQLNQLILTQEYVRSITKVMDFRYFLSEGNTLDKTPVKLIEIPNEGIFLHDGLTRCLGCYLSGRSYLREFEYTIKTLTEEDYETFAPDNGWFTPFNPINSVRSYKFMYYKDLIMKVYKETGQEIYLNYQHRYSRPREIKYLQEIL